MPDTSVNAMILGEEGGYRVISDPIHSFGMSCRRQTAFAEFDDTRIWSACDKKLEALQAMLADCFERISEI